MFNETADTKNIISTPSPLLHRNWRETLQTLSALFKFRIVLLLLFSAIGGAFIGAGAVPSLSKFLLILLTGGLAASGAAAWNQYIERKSDDQMGRTRNRRPLVNGEIVNPSWVPIVATLMIVVPVLGTLPFNKEWAFFLALGAFIYVIIYTIWLKPRTLLNIVIGGAAGSAAVLTGGAALGAWDSPGVLVLALLLFLWTPTHFWSLAMVYREDYERVDVPMLPARTSMKKAAWWILLHTFPTAVAAILLGALPALGWLYLLPVTLFSLRLLWHNIQLILTPTPPNAKRLFLSSNIYLMVVLLAICIDILLR